PVGITSQPKSHTQCPLGTVTFPVSGEPGISSNVTWWVKSPSDTDFHPIHPEDSVDALHYSIISNATSSTLVVSNFATFDGYQFRYHFATPAESYRSPSVTLTVLPATPIYVRANAQLG